MFACIVATHTRAPENEAPIMEYYNKFLETPGLLHAYVSRGMDDPMAVRSVAVWESREACERYLESQLRGQIDYALPPINRVTYEVTAGK